MIAVKVGAEVNAKAPSGFSTDYLIKLITRDDYWILCAESIDDMLWEFHDLKNNFIYYLNFMKNLIKCMANFIWASESQQPTEQYAKCSAKSNSCLLTRCSYR